MSLAKAHPTWGLVWWGLALGMLDVDDRPDSAMVLLKKAGEAGGMREGILELAIARALLRQGKRVEGEAHLRRAAQDTSWASRSTFSSTIAQYLILDGAPPAVFGLNPVFVLGSGLRIREAESFWGLDSATFIRLAVERFSRPIWRNPILTHVHNYRLEDSAGSVLVIPFSLYRQTLFSYPHPAGGGRVVFPLQLHVVAIRDPDGLTIVLDTLRELVSTTPRTVEPDIDVSSLQLATELRLPPGRYGILLSVSQRDGTGATSFLPLVEIPSVVPGQLRVSDLVVGNETSGLPWRRTQPTANFHPLGEWNAKDGISLFAQIGGLKPGEHYRTTLDFLPLSSINPPNQSGVHTDSSVTLTFDDVAGDTSVVWSKSLEARRLKNGAYCVQLTVQRGAEIERRTDMLEVGLWTNSWEEWLYYRYTSPIPQQCLNFRPLRPVDRG